jgi:hypothetical protein
MVAMSAAPVAVAARLARAPTRRARASSRRAPRVVASVASRSSEATDGSPAPIGEVTRAVLSFHDTDSAGRADDAVVPLASWAKRFGWDVATAERVLWECDVPTRGCVSTAGVPAHLPSTHVEGDDQKVVDASVARAGLWVTHVFPDHVMCALRGTASTKRHALDAAFQNLVTDHPSVAPSESFLRRVQKKNTNAAFAVVLKALRRRYPSETEAPFAVFTRKSTKSRLYTCVARADGLDETSEARVDALRAEGWDVVFGEAGGDSKDRAEKRLEETKKSVPDSGTSVEAVAEMRARREKRAGTMRLAGIQKTPEEVSRDANDRARRVRASGW